MMKFEQTKVNGLDCLEWSRPGCRMVLCAEIVGKSIYGTLTAISRDVDYDFKISGTIVVDETYPSGRGLEIDDFRTSKPADDAEIDIWHFDEAIGVYVRKFSLNMYPSNFFVGTVRGDIYHGYRWLPGLCLTGQMSVVDNTWYIIKGRSITENMKMTGTWSGTGYSLFVGAVEWEDDSFDGFTDTRSGYADGTLVKSDGSTLIGKFINWKLIEPG